MLYLESLTFMTKEQVIEKCCIPELLQEELFAKMPVAVMQNGKPLYFESQVDAFLQEWFSYHPTGSQYQKVHGARPRGGRKVSTDEEAIFALSLKSASKSLKEIVTAMKTKWPNRKDKFTPDAVRKTMARYEQRQERMCQNNLGINPISPR
jgi:hypothetical protein